MDSQKVKTLFEELLDSSITTLQSLRLLEGPLTQAADLVSRCLIGGQKLLVCGHGGSAADASHLATELVVRYVEDRRPYPAISLTESGSTLTAAGNDYGFEQVFARQVWAFGQLGDVLVVISTSGQSPAVLRALEQANKMGLASISLLGRDGGKAKGMANIDLIVPGDSTARIQEAHGVLIHALCEMVERALLG